MGGRGLAMKYALALALAAILVASGPAVAITIDTVPVGNPGNASRFDGTGYFGGVSTSYRIATTEVTNAQYVQFLNDVAASDPYSLYYPGLSSRYGIARTGSAGSYSYSVKPNVVGVGPDGSDYTYGDKPVVFVTWSDAARFANWVNNGATPGASTETGAYNLAMGNGNGVSRNSNATWFLPTENEWYKAAYYDPSTSTYWNYATKSNAAPDNNVPTSDSGNSANYFAGAYTNPLDPDGSYPFTSAGAYSLSKSPYGTLDQNGNVAEWTETMGTASQRIYRGGAADTDATTLSSSSRVVQNATYENSDVGFRLATIAAAAGIAGDYNNNGVVDAADYVLYRKFLGQSVTLPNDSTPGSVTTADYDVWRAHFGQSAGAGSGSVGLGESAVPEPSAILLCAVAWGLFAVGRRHN
jgi:formylglycine-generating enzyme